MPGWVPPRLWPLLGDDLTAITADQLRSLVGVVEDVDLDFKRDGWARTDGGTKEAAYDVAAFANAGGGLLVVGVDEDGAGRASALVGIDSGADLSLWVDQVVAARVAPPPSVSQARIDVAGQEVLVVAVEPSASAPHAVAVGDGALRYPIRHGSVRRYLTEAEVSDRYRRRLSASAALAEQVNDLIAEVDTLVDPLDPERHGNAWLAVGLVPDVPGSMDLRRGIDDQWRSWADPDIRRFPCFGPRKLPYASFGFQSIELNDGLDRHTPYLGAARLWTDGRALVIFGYHGDNRRPDESADVHIYDEYVVSDLINGVAVVAGHASRARASGAANLVAKIGWARGDLVLSEPRSTFSGPIEGLRHVAETGVSRRTVALDTLHAPRGRLGAVRLLAGDLLSSFGWPEPQQITADLQLVRRRFNREWHGPVDAWATANGIEVVENLSE